MNNTNIHLYWRNKCGWIDGQFHWWDVVAHTLSGVILSFLGFIIIFILDKDIDFTDNKKLILAILFSASLGIAGGLFGKFTSLKY